MWPRGWAWQRKHERSGLSVEPRMAKFLWRNWWCRRAGLKSLTNIRSQVSFSRSHPNTSATQGAIESIAVLQEISEQVSNWTHCLNVYFKTCESVWRRRQYEPWTRRWRTRLLCVAGWCVRCSIEGRANVRGRRTLKNKRQKSLDEAKEKKGFIPRAQDMPNKKMWGKQ